MPKADDATDAPFLMFVPKTPAESAVLAGEIIAIFHAISAVHTSDDLGTAATTDTARGPGHQRGLLA